MTRVVFLRSKGLRIAKPTLVLSAITLVAAVAACRGGVSEDPPINLAPDMDQQNHRRPQTDHAAGQTDGPGAHPAPGQTNRATREAGWRARSELCAGAQRLGAGDRADWPQLSQHWIWFDPHAEGPHPDELPRRQ